MTNEKITRSYKDSLFRIVFREKKELLDLYNAINGTDYNDPDALIVTTIENVIYMGLKNDVSFLIEDVMNLYEQQSSWNPNMPLRGLFYFSNIYQGYIAEHHLDIYSSTLLKLPTPRYIVLYNGLKTEPDRQELYLSQAFMKPDGIPCLECTAQIININFGHNKELLESCRKLHDYSYFVAKVRDHLKEGLLLEAAVDQAVRFCIQNNVLKELLEKHRAEVTNVILEEYNEELHEKTLYEQGRAAGIQEGKAAGIQEGKAAGIREGKAAGIREGQAEALLRFLERRNGGPVSTELKTAILQESDPDQIAKWLDLVFDGISVQELEESIVK